jgi:hypothetical protein
MFESVSSSSRRLGGWRRLIGGCLITTRGLDLSLTVFKRATYHESETEQAGTCEIAGRMCLVDNAGADFV